jgi:protein gp37
VRLKVFCGSMLDPFEDRPELEAPRVRLWQLIAETPHLDWLLLTKRIENVDDMVPAAWHDDPPEGGFPSNVWIGVSAGTQQAADSRLPVLRRIRARYLFVSYEPALEEIDFTKHFEPWRCSRCGRRNDSPRPMRCPTGSICHNGTIKPQIHWLIVGAESKGARPGRRMDEDWVARARDQCVTYGLSLFYKQRFDDGKKVATPDLDGRKWMESP